MCTVFIFKQLQVDSRGKINILEGVIVRNELYEHTSNSEGYQVRNMNELMKECMCIYTCVCVCVCVHTHTHTHTHMYVCMYWF